MNRKSKKTPTFLLLYYRFDNIKIGSNSRQSGSGVDSAQFAF